MTTDNALHDLRTAAELRTAGEGPVVRPVTQYVEIVTGPHRAFLERGRTMYCVRGDDGLWHILPPGAVPMSVREMAAAVRAVRWPAG